MIITIISYLIFTNALTSLKEKSVFYSRTTILTLLSAGFICYNNLFIINLERGVSLYNNIYNVTSLTQVISISILLISTIMLIYNSFYHRTLISNVSSIQSITLRKGNYNIIGLGDVKTEQYRIIEYPLIILFIICGGISLINSANLISLTISLGFGLYSYIKITTTTKRYYLPIETNKIFILCLALFIVSNLQDNITNGYTLLTLNNINLTAILLHLIKYLVSSMSNKLKYIVYNGLLKLILQYFPLIGCYLIQVLEVKSRIDTLNEYFKISKYLFTVCSVIYLSLTTNIGIYELFNFIIFLVSIYRLSYAILNGKKPYNDNSFLYYLDILISVIALIITYDDFLNVICGLITVLKTGAKPSSSNTYTTGEGSSNRNNPGMSPKPSGNNTSLDLSSRKRKRSQDYMENEQYNSDSSINESDSWEVKTKKKRNRSAIDNAVHVLQGKNSTYSDNTKIFTKTEDLKAGLIKDDINSNDFLHDPQYLSITDRTNLKRKYLYYTHKLSPIQRNYYYKNSGTRGSILTERYSSYLNGFGKSNIDYCSPKSNGKPLTGKQICKNIFLMKQLEDNLHSYI